MNALVDRWTSSKIGINASNAMKLKDTLSNCVALLFISLILSLGLFQCGGSKSITLLPDLPVRLENLDGTSQQTVLSDMVLVKGGSFEMGSDSQDIDELPRHKITIRDFYIDLYEVTNQMFKLFIDQTHYKTTAEAQGFGWIYRMDHWEKAQGKKWDTIYSDSEKPKDFDSFPVTMVSWFDAYHYCEHFKKRLPSEAEWEYAAGGPDHFQYPLGNEYDETKYACGLPSATPVGKYPANGFGIFDMGGNAWEWTNSWYNYYPYDEKDGRELLEAIHPDFEKRVPRGGSWANFADDTRIFRCSNRSTNGDPANCYQNIGFRCAF